MNGSNLVLPAVLGRYTLLERVGGGGMASVYRSSLTVGGGFEKEVAVKVIRSELASDPVFTEMFQDEARISARLTHANLVHTFDFGQVDGVFFLAMEYVRGRTLANLLRTCRTLGKPLGVPLAVHVAAEVARGLGFAHRLEGSDGSPLGLVHRDVSPQNVLISREGEVKLADFGIAKAAERTHVTQPGKVRGKCAYMAPEQARGLPVDPRTDVFALGIVLWECLARRPLFDGPSDGAVLLQVIQREIAPPSRFDPEIPAALDELVLAMLSREPSERPANGDEVARELAALNLRLVQSLDQIDLAGFLRRLSTGTAVLPAVPAGAGSVGVATGDVVFEEGPTSPEPRPRAGREGRVDAADGAEIVPFDPNAETLVRQQEPPQGSEDGTPIAGTTAPGPVALEDRGPAGLAVAAGPTVAASTTVVAGPTGGPGAGEGAPAEAPVVSGPAAHPVGGDPAPVQPGRLRSRRLWPAVVGLCAGALVVGWAVGLVPVENPRGGGLAADGGPAVGAGPGAPTVHAATGREEPIPDRGDAEGPLPDADVEKGVGVGVGLGAGGGVEGGAVAEGAHLSPVGPATEGDGSGWGAAAPGEDGSAGPGAPRAMEGTPLVAATGEAPADPPTEATGATAPGPTRAVPPTSARGRAQAPGHHPRGEGREAQAGRKAAEQRNPPAPSAAAPVATAPAPAPAPTPVAVAQGATGTLILSSKMVGEVAVVVDGKRVEIAPQVPIPLTVPAGNRLLVFELGKNGLRCTIPVAVESAGRHPIQLQADGQVVRLTREGRVPIPCGS